jgi:hypothetical protein
MYHILGVHGLAVAGLGVDLSASPMGVGDGYGAAVLARI